jgi:ribosomal protein L40E
MKCLSCGFDNTEAGSRCQQCGTTLSQICPKCGAHLSAESSTCNICGSPLGDTDLPTTPQPRSPSAQQKKPQGIRGSGWQPADNFMSDDRPRHVARSGKTVGVVRGVRERTEQSGYQNHKMVNIVTFRVERYDEEGHALPPIPVEMEARRFQGILSEGDWVELPGRWQPGETLHLRQVRNLTTGSNFRARAYFGSPYIAKLLLFLMFLVLMVLFVTNWRDIISKISGPTTGPKRIDVNIKR